MSLKLIDHEEALEIIDSLEQRNLLHAQSRVLADVVRERRCGTTPDPEARKDPVYRMCLELDYEVIEEREYDDRDEVDEYATQLRQQYVWSFDKIMNYLRIAHMPQLAEVGL